MKSILYVVVGIIIYIIIKLISHESRKKYYLNIAYEGMIKEKYLDSNNRGIPYIIVDGYNTNFQLEDNRNFKLIEVGDYIIKRKGVLRHLVVKRIYNIVDTLVLIPSL